MGADLVGFIVKGPKTLGGNGLGIEKAEQNYAAAQRLLEALEESKDDDSRQSAVAHWRLGVNLNDFGFDLDDEMLEEVLSACFGFEGGGFQEFIDWWDDGPSSRDVMWRHFPDEPESKIVAVGELSWGDEPEGQGYQMIKFALWCGIAAPLGIK